MSTRDDGLRPEEFGEAAEAAIANALAQGAGAPTATLAEAGLLGVCAAEAHGGLGLDLAFAVPIAQAAGRLRLSFPLAEQIVLARHLPGPLAASLADGTKTATIAWQGRVATGWIGHARQAQHCDWLLVREGDAAVLLDVTGAPQRLDPALDPEQPQAWLDVTGRPALARLDAETTRALWRDGALLLAATVHGAADGALSAAVSHTSTRVQFGGPLSARQAVRHLLARMKLFHEASGAAIGRALARNEWDQPRAVQPALALALQHAAFIIEKAIHLHGGMGFTWEVPLHRALREVRKLDAAWGAGGLARSVGQDFIHTVGA